LDLDWACSAPLLEINLTPLFPNYLFFVNALIISKEILEECAKAYFWLADVTAHDQISQVFPIYTCIYILQAIKDLRWERPGNEATGRR